MLLFVHIHKHYFLFNLLLFITNFYFKGAYLSTTRFFVTSLMFTLFWNFGCNIVCCLQNIYRNTCCLCTKLWSFNVVSRILIQTSRTKNVSLPWLTMNPTTSFSTPSSILTKFCFSFFVTASNFYKTPIAIHVVCVRILDR